MQLLQTLNKIRDYFTDKKSIMCSKTIDVEAAFTMTEMNNECNVNFLPTCPIGIWHTYSCQFSID